MVKPLRAHPSVLGSIPESVGRIRSPGIGSARSVSIGSNRAGHVEPIEDAADERTAQAMVVLCRPTSCRVVGSSRTVPVDGKL